MVVTGEKLEAFQAWKQAHGMRKGEVVNCLCKPTGVEGVIAVNALCPEHSGKAVSGPWAKGPGKNPVHESMTPLTICADEGVGVAISRSFDVRVWRTEAEAFGWGDNTDLQSAAMELRKSLDGRTAANAGYIASTLGALPRVAAVEVLESKTRRGIVFYPDWS